MELRQTHDLKLMLGHAKLARSSFYYHNKRQPIDKYLEIKESISVIYHQHKGRLGYRRITILLRQQGHAINHKTVLRLMGLMGLKSLIRVKKYRFYKGNLGKTAPNILDRDFRAAQPNQKWATDITEFHVAGKKLYLSPVIDLFNGEIISYEISERPTFEQVEAMLQKSIRKLPAGRNLILHSDQGWQYQMKQYHRLLKGKGITQSMSRKGNCLDNAVIENFFGILKCELYYINKFSSIDHLRQEIKKYIDYYNNDRIKLNLNGMSPTQYRTHYYQSNY